MVREILPCHGGYSLMNAMGILSALFNLSWIMYPDEEFCQCQVQWGMNDNFFFFFLPLLNPILKWRWQKKDKMTKINMNRDFCPFQLHDHLNSYVWLWNWNGNQLLFWQWQILCVLPSVCRGFFSVSAGEYFSFSRLLYERRSLKWPVRLYKQKTYLSSLICVIH